MTICDLQSLAGITPTRLQNVKAFYSTRNVNKQTRPQPTQASYDIQRRLCSWLSRTSRCRSPIVLISSTNGIHPALIQNKQVNLCANSPAVEIAYEHQSEAAKRGRSHISPETEVCARLLTPERLQRCIKAQLGMKIKKTHKPLQAFWRLAQICIAVTHMLKWLFGFHHFLNGCISKTGGCAT